MDKNFYFIAEELGYKFRDIGLLKQAFTRKSYSAENGGENNEILEFIGDKALDLAVIRITTKYLGIETFNKDFLEFKLKNNDENNKSQEAIYTVVKSELVRKKSLAKCISDKEYQQHLIMGKGDIKRHIEEQDSVKEDLFEAIIGAIAIDSDFDMDAITKVVERLIDFDSFFNEGYRKDNSVGLLQEWCAKKRYSLPIYTYCDFEDCFLCSVSIKELDSINNQWIGKDKSKALARAKAAQKAYNYLNARVTKVAEYKIDNLNKEFISKKIKEDKIKEAIDYALNKKVITNFKMEFCDYNKDIITATDLANKETRDMVLEFISDYRFECYIIVNEFDGVFSAFGDTKEEAYNDACKELLLELITER